MYDGRGPSQISIIAEQRTTMPIQSALRVAAPQDTYFSSKMGNVMNAQEIIPEGMTRRAKAIAKAGSFDAALADGSIAKFETVTAAEALVLGLLRQNVRKYLVIFGHGSTDLGEVLRIYSDAGVTQTFNFRNECAMAHAGTALRWQYGEVPAVVTSIGPGALLALAGSLVSITNGIGVYHIYGDETTLREGYNFQQVRKRDQQIFSRMTALAGESYFLHTPEAIRDLLRRGSAKVHHPYDAGPFYIHMPMNIQPAIIANLNLESLPSPVTARPGPAPDKDIVAAADILSRYRRIVIKAGGGAINASKELQQFAEQIGAVVVASPVSQGVLPDSHPHYMHISGTKGTLSGNYAAENADLLIAIGTRAVCQADSSGLGYPKVDHVINLNANIDDATHYNRTSALLGDIGQSLGQLSAELARRNHDAAGTQPWLEACRAKKHEWAEIRRVKYANAVAFDEMWQRNVLTQPAALKTIVDFARDTNAVKLFDAGDVQSNALQVCEDDFVGQTVTDGGSSFMGFAVSGLVASALADNPVFTIAISGDGSFWMNPQALIDAVEHGTHGAVVVLDNRRMSSITGLQRSQYGAEFKTNDSVAIDYRSFAASISGLHYLDGGTSTETLAEALHKAKKTDGLTLIHVPVVWDEKGTSSLGAYGRWNVGNWVEDAQRDYLRQDL